MSFKKLGKKKPYTEEEISSKPCFRCGKKSYYQWNICADGKYHPVCKECDIELNKLVLDFMGFKHKKALLRKYIKKVNNE